MNDFLQRLKQRKLVQWAVAYVAAAFALLQGVDIVAQRFGWPDAVERGLIIGSCVGFFITLVLAWYHGEHGAQKVTGAELAILALLLSVGGGLLWHFAGAVHGPIAKTGAATVPIVTASPSHSIPEKSIAVLPFANLSSDQENAYFAAGIQDEILTRLAKVGALKVISRTSTAHYASSPENLPEIAQQLGVANILEGSVQKAANAVHVNVQLIRAASDEHLWAESYDRKLDDIFSVEGEVAGAIAQQLNAKLSGVEKHDLANKPTNNPEAYDAYLRGLAFQGGVDDFKNSVLNSISEFEEAVRLDPNFALAWAHLCRQEGLLFLNVDQSRQRREATRKALDMAISLGPDLVETKLADGFYHYFVERDYEGAKTRFEGIRGTNPNNSSAPEALGGIARRQGRWEESRILYAQAVELDPQNVFLLTDAALTDLATRDVATARKHLGRARDLSPKNSTVLTFLAISFQLSGDITQAQTFFDTVQPAEGDAIYVNGAAANAILSRHYEPALAMLKAQLEKPEILGSALASFENIYGDLQRNAGDAAATVTYQKAREAAQESLRAQPNSPDSLIVLAWAETWLEDKAAAITHARRAIALLPASKDAFVGPTYEDTLARIQAHFGDKEDAIAALQHLLSISYAAPSVTPAFLRLDPDWDNLRGDPRFEALLK